MRFEGKTPASRLLTALLPWTRGRRPDWVIRLGLFIYDHLGGRKILPATRSLDLRKDSAGRPLRQALTKGYEYSDCWVQDSRLVVLNARDAAARNADILTRTTVARARRVDGLWEIETEGRDGLARHYARALVNAAGPWVGQVIRGPLGLDSRENVRLVRGSHIVTRRLYDHDRCYFFQGSDGRIIFAIPYEQDFTLIGTTDKDHQGDPLNAGCTTEEQDYLCALASEYFARPVTRDDIVWTYSGVRPLYDDGASSATAAATRDYVLSLIHEADGQAPLLNVFGGKITTYRRLAEHALEKLAAFFPRASGAWTAGVALPGGDFPHDGVSSLIDRLRADYPFLTGDWARRLIRTYGTDAWRLLGNARSARDLGPAYGATLTLTEMRWLVHEEYARSAEDILWRRTRLGLHFDAQAVADLDAAIQSEVQALP